MTELEKSRLAEKHMKNLGISREEAYQLIADDEAIDKGEKLFELTKEQKKASKEARSVGTKTVNTKPQREKKVDKEKQTLVDTLKSAIENLESVESVEVLNDEREFVFHIGEKKYKVVLSAPRS